MVLPGVVLGTFVFAALGILALVAVASGPSAQSPEEIVAIDNAKPRFSGELLGIFLGTPEVLSEQGYLRSPGADCPGGFDTVPNDASVPAVPRYLPPGAFQPERAPSIAADQPNASALICRDTAKPYRTWRYYELEAKDGWVPTILINRVLETRPYRETDAPQDRVQVMTLGDREVIVVRPVVPEGWRAGTNVLIPEPGGYTVIQSHVVSYDEVVRVAESVLYSVPTPV
jgi:hypothetical protein